MRPASQGRAGLLFMIGAIRCEDVADALYTFFFIVSFSFGFAGSRHTSTLGRTINDHQAVPTAHHEAIVHLRHSGNSLAVRVLPASSRPRRVRVRVHQCARAWQWSLGIPRRSAAADLTDGWHGCSHRLSLDSLFRRHDALPVHDTSSQTDSTTRKSSSSSTSRQTAVFDSARANAPPRVRRKKPASTNAVSNASHSV